MKKISDFEESTTQFCTHVVPENHEPYILPESAVRSFFSRAFTSYCASLSLRARSLMHVNLIERNFFFVSQ